MTADEQKQFDAYMAMVSEHGSSQALIGIRCGCCGWALMTFPDNKPYAERYVKCVNSNCAEHSKRYHAPMFPLRPYRGKGGE